MSEVLEPHMKGAMKRSRPLILTIGVLVTLYLLTPVLIVIPAAFNSGNYLEVPPQGFSFRWFSEFFSSPSWMRSLKISLQLGLMASLLATALATLAVVGLARAPRLATWMRPLFFIPMVFPVVVLALGLYKAGLAFGFNGTLWPLLLGQALTSLPLAFIAVSAGMVRVDPALTRAAESMGSSWWWTILRVELPLLRGSIMTAFLLAFVFALDEVVLALFLAPAAETTLPARLYAASSRTLSPMLASSSVSMIVGVLFASVLYYLTLRLTKSRRA